MNGGRGQGSIWRRGDGRWVGRLLIDGDDGRRVPKDLYGATKREVREKLTRVLRDGDLGVAVVRDERQTLDAHLQRWLVDVVRPSVRPSTAVRYEELVRLHIVPTLGRVPIAKLTPQQVQGLLNAKLAAGLAPRTVHHLRACLRRAIGQAMRWGVVPRNVVVLTDPPRVPRYEVKVPTPAEAKALLEAVRGDRLEALYVVALATGVRSGEARGLRWEDVDLDAGTIRIRHALQRVGGRLALVEPKTSLSRRTLALPEFAIAALRDHRVRQLHDRLWAGTRWVEGNFVFTTTIGTPLDGTNVTHRFQKLLERAGLPRQRLHDLRHACASLLLAQGVHARVVMEQLGHSQISLTMNTYSHVLPALQREAASQMEALLSAEA